MRPWPAPSASHQAGTTGPDAPSKLVTAGATSGPHLTGLLRTTPANNGQASSLVNAAIEAAAQVATTARRSLARRKSLGSSTLLATRAGLGGVVGYSLPKWMGCAAPVNREVCD